MYTIRYYYSSLSKQIFIGVIMLTFLIRFVLFFVGGFYKEAYTGATIVAYALVLAFCAFLLFAFRFFYAEFDEERIIQHNLLTKKETSLDLAPVKRAVFSKRGIRLFYEGDEAPRFFLSFYMLGIISAVGVENFMNLMKNNGVEVQQDYKVLPGYGSFSHWLGRFYMIFSVVIALNSVQYVVLIYLILAAK